MSPIFSPDGSRIAYTVVQGNDWDTWMAPITGGGPRLWLPNASGLSWIDKPMLLFSERRKGIHMGIVTAEESQAAARDIYMPADDRGMAHRSYVSPDGKWALVVEMENNTWIPCRLGPMDGSSPGRKVGPPGAGCTFAAWSPDGKWMYLSCNAGGYFHTWRQRFPDGQSKQITSGRTQEEGIAMAPDGHSFITSVGLNQSAVWVHDSSGDRQISLEGYAYQPKFTPDGKRLLYRILKGASPTSDPSELWMAELDSGRNERLLPGLPAVGYFPYDISLDGLQVVVASPDREGKSQLWLAPIDRRSPPRQIPSVGGPRTVLFGPSGEIFYPSRDSPEFAYQARGDGTEPRNISAQPVAGMRGVSPDGRWLLVITRGERGGFTQAVPVRGGTPVRIYESDVRLRWSPNGKFVFMSAGRAGQMGSSGTPGKTYIVPLTPGRVLPELPAGGFHSEAEMARIPGVRVIDSPDVAPSPTPQVYAFSRETVQRNLYRIPVP